MVHLQRPQTQIRLICVACWITKATDTHSEYVMIIAFVRQQWLHESTLILRLQAHCPLCLYFFYEGINSKEIFKSILVQAFNETEIDFR